ncbi:MAG: preprotein translocase subunit SecG [Lachnospiraceae bacterium]|nr:preprotein translocase subunit SecG [Lachnospiraceae bacterium]
MQVVKVIVMVAFILICVALTFLVLMQEGKQQGLGAIGGIADSYWGKNKGRSMEGVLVKITTWLAVLFMVLALILNIPVLFR